MNQVVIALSCLHTARQVFSIYLFHFIKNKKGLSALVCGVHSIRTPSHITKVSSLETSLEIFLRGTESTTGYFVSAFNESVIHPEGLLQWSGHLQSSSAQWKDAISYIRIQCFLCFTCIYGGLKVKMSQPVLRLTGLWKSNANHAH